MSFALDLFPEYKARLQRFADQLGRIPEPGDRPTDLHWPDDGPQDWSAFVAEAAAETEAVKQALRPRVTPMVAQGLTLCWTHLIAERDSGHRCDWWSGLTPDERRMATRGIDWIEDTVAWAKRVGEAVDPHRSEK
jgi:hypothetical protein